MRAADREADEAVHGRRLVQPVVDLLVARAAAEQHADHAVAAAARAVCWASISPSERSSTPSIFQMSTSMPTSWMSAIARRISSGRSSAS